MRGQEERRGPRPGPANVWRVQHRPNGAVEHPISQNIDRPRFTVEVLAWGLFLVFRSSA